MATNYEKRFEALDKNTVYTFSEKVRQYGSTVTFHQPVKIIETGVPIAGITQLVGVRVERTDTGEQCDTHVKNITRPWAEFVDLEVDRDNVLAIVRGRAEQLQVVDVPESWRTRLAANHLPENVFVLDGDEVYALVEYTTARKLSQKKGQGQEERITSVTLIEEDGTVHELKKRNQFKKFIESAKDKGTNKCDYEYVKLVGKHIFAAPVDIEALTDEVVNRLRQGEATLYENRRRPGVGVADVATAVVKETLGN